MKYRDFYLQEVVLLMTTQAQLDIFAHLTKCLEEQGITVVCGLLLQEQLHMEIPPAESLYISDCGEVARILAEQGVAVLGYSHEANRQENFSGVAYLVEGMEGVDPVYLERVYRRYKEIPWMILETEHCYVRESCVEDVEVFYQIYSEPAVHRYIERLYENPAEEKAYMQAYIGNMYRYYEFGIWTVIDKMSGEIIGRAGIDLQEDREIPELGYIFATKWQGRGLAEEVSRACLKYAKEELTLEQIQVHIHPENVASLKLAKKLGFEYKESLCRDAKEYKVLQRSI